MPGELGMTELEAVNNMLRTVGLRPVTALPDPADASDASEAQRVLSRVTEELQVKGHVGTTYGPNSYTLDGSSNIDIHDNVDADTVWIECVAPPRHAGRLKIGNSGLATNVVENTTNLGTASTDVIWLKYRVKEAWADLPPNLKHQIVRAAEREYQLETRGRADLDNYLKEREVSSFISSDREIDTSPDNPHGPPILGGGPPQQ